MNTIQVQLQLLRQQNDMIQLAFEGLLTGDADLFLTGTNTATLCDQVLNGMDSPKSPSKSQL